MLEYWISIVKVKLTTSTEAKIATKPKKRSLSMAVACKIDFNHSQICSLINYIIQVGVGGGSHKKRQDEGGLVRRKALPRMA